MHFLHTLYKLLINNMTYDMKEYERAVIFRLGRLLSGGARGPGVFFVIPCVDIYEKVDIRTQTFDVPPQEVSAGIFIFSSLLSSALTSTFQVWLR